MRWILSVLLSVVSTSTLAWDYLNNVDNVIVDQCIKDCSNHDFNESAHYGYSCDNNCNVGQQCQTGCKLWRSALKSNCQTACNATSDLVTLKEQYCVMGCNDAVLQLKNHLGIPPAPALVADSLSANSLKLEWSFPKAKLVGLDCHVQWRIEDLSASWQFCRNVTWNEDNTVVLINNLEAYTKYRFRIAMLVPHPGEPIVSLTSVVISTLSMGPPKSRPIIVRAAPVDFSSISVSWEPGPFPHGPLLSYVIQITDNDPEGHSEVKDISPNHTYTMINAQPATNYTISVSMRNYYGSGPAAKAVVQTPPEPIVKNTEKPVLILGTENSIIKQGASIADEPVILYESKNKIKGIAIHIAKKLLFISDSSESVIKMALSEGPKDVKFILKPPQSDFIPLDLSVDWLNNQLYILGQLRQQKKFIIKRCTLDGDNLTVAYAGLTHRPNAMEVDPYNGYLFWTIQDVNRGGLYRLDTSEISNGIKYEGKVDRIVNETNLGAFIVDPMNFRVLVSYQNQNTVKAVSFDGKEIVNLRAEVTNSKLQKVTSLATDTTKFYWTNGDDIFYEEYQHTYFHNSYPDLFSRKYKKVFVNLTACQPTPIPLNPPTSMQVIFGSNIAKAKWQPPHLLGVQGKGAWKNWSYEIFIKDLTTQEVLTHNEINGTSFTIEDLQENTKYLIKVAAYTKSGHGSWSSEFHGLTLGSRVKPVILWSASEGLLKSNAAGENFETILHNGRFKNFHFTDLNWYKDQIFMVTNSSLVYSFNLTSSELDLIEDLNSVGSVAVDWIGKKLYWSIPKQQLIIRKDLNGTQQEPLPLSTLAKVLSVDSIQGYLYWSSGVAVFGAHLNGMDRIDYFLPEDFSGDRIFGLTLDMDHKFVYWIVKGSEGSDLFRASMAGYHANPPRTVEKVAGLLRSNIQGSLCYFHNRLLWLQDKQNAAISDLSGLNIAKVTGKSMTGLYMVYVMDGSLHQLPDGRSSNELQVIPQAVNASSVKVLGSHNNFNITWQAINNTNYGTVFYEVQIDSLSGNNSTLITTQPSIKYWRSVLPYTKLNICIRAFTYWGSASLIKVHIFSPPSTPSSPQALRAFVLCDQGTSCQNEPVTVNFRWKPPIYPNGLIKGYKVSVFNKNQEEPVQKEFVNSTQLQATIKNLNSSQVYYFQVEGFTEIGDGVPSEQLLVNTTKKNPIPTFLVSSNDTLYLYDNDALEKRFLLQNILPAIQIDYILKEQKIIWANEMHELFIYNMNTSTKAKIGDLIDQPSTLTVDWLERSIYYVVQKDDGLVYKIDLNSLMDGVPLRNQLMFSIKGQVGKLKVSPFTQKLYWTEANETFFHLMKGSLDGSLREPFFPDNSSCLYDDLEPNFNLDHSLNPYEPTITLIDLESQDLIEANSSGCRVLVRNEETRGRGFPWNQLMVDSDTIYWTNHHEKLFSLQKNQRTGDFVSNVRFDEVKIFGQYLQPYPGIKCLSPKQDTELQVKLMGKTASSLILSMPQVGVEEGCPMTSRASIQYQISYREINSSRIKQVASYDTRVTVNGLKPFTKYLLSLSVSNYFTTPEEVLQGNAITGQTAPGEPSKPRNISASVLSPTLAEVFWLSPEHLNGLIVYYEIQVQTEVALSGVRQNREQSVSETQNLSGNHSALLYNLSPNETYTILVRAYSETNLTFSESDKVEITTFPEPSNLTLVNKTAYSLNISWVISLNIIKYSVEYAEITSNDWTAIEEVSQVDNLVLIEVNKLKPKWQYKFRVNLLYERYPELYSWPGDQRFTFETLGDKPSPPSMLFIQYVKPNVYKVCWEKSKENGSPIEMYKLEGLQLFANRERRSANRSAWSYLSPSIEEIEMEWEPLYNGTNTSWIIEGLSDKYKYLFRVSALNSYGWSVPSESGTFDFYEAARMADSRNNFMLTMIAVAVPVLVLLSLFILYLICSGRCGKQKKLQQVMPIGRGPDVELATLRELPRSGIHSTNILYVSAQPTPEDLTLLPHIRREHITLTKFLGSGAFGEVFEGKALLSNEEVKVAVKTLRKGASDQEKTEFLQEAQLMSHFKHKHILQLLGVCLDNDPNFIIMELMLGGDLLTYLRSSRASYLNTPALSLIELLKMCVDVAKGCRYLEEMHFVHRDLACRNCLVSSVEADCRIVKIGDFGLARDIYKNDYYRKEGEGLLPVRWMSPESLVDGVFTSQSDVWAFGVLLWEIMTLGQQPYPARNNLEVLHYVRGGGRLGKPADCPEDLHNLMLNCWEFEPTKRPTFKYCLEILDKLHLQNLRNPLTGAHQGQYISTVTEECEGISNAIYFRKFKDENHNSAGETDAKEKVPFLPEPQATSTTTATTAPPKYVELIYEAKEEPLPNDGYEIPSGMLQQRTLSEGSVNQRNSISSSNEQKRS